MKKIKKMMSVRLSVDLQETIKRQAELENRSMTNWIETTLWAALNVKAARRGLKKEENNEN